MGNWVLLASFVSANWHVLPLALVVSLVYSATRHEDSGEIVHHAIRLFFMIMGFVLVVFGLLYLASLRL
jgi:hypothetical protein